MLRATKDYPYPEAHLPIWSELRDKLYRLLLTRWQKVKEIYPDTGKGIIQRVRELWRPIETILKLENVVEQEVDEIKPAFLESMIETQAELSDREHDSEKAGRRKNKLEPHTALRLREVRVY